MQPVDERSLFFFVTRAHLSWNEIYSLSVCPFMRHISLSDTDTLFPLIPFSLFVSSFAHIIHFSLRWFSSLSLPFYSFPLDQNLSWISVRFQTKNPSVARALGTNNEHLNTRIMDWRFFSKIQWIWFKCKEEYSLWSLSRDVGEGKRCWIIFSLNKRVVSVSSQISHTLPPSPSHPSKNILVHVRLHNLDPSFL